MCQYLNACHRTERAVSKKFDVGPPPCEQAGPNAGSIAPSSSPGTVLLFSRMG